MKKTAVCVACNAQTNGVRSRVAFEHTCGKGSNGSTTEKIPQYKGKLFPGEGAFQFWLKRTSVMSVEFMDNGQDLMKIWVDELGEILHCDLQAEIWNGMFINMNEIYLNSPLELWKPKGGEGSWKICYKLVVSRVIFDNNKKDRK